MKPDGHSSPVDHHIQALVVKRLFTSSGAVPFSDLKPDDIENSLFTYHIHKLERRGVIEKSDTGYLLTPEGVRWVNFTSPMTLRQKRVPRVLLNLVVFSPDKKQVILARRTSRAAEYLGSYIFPSGFQPYGLPIEEAVEVVAEKTIGVLPEGLEYRGVYEAIYKNEKGESTHWVLPTFSGTVLQVILPSQDHYEQNWVKVGDLTDNPGAYPHPIAEVVQALLDGKKFEYQTYSF